MIEFNGERYFDDRMFLLLIARGRLDPPEDGLASTTIYHSSIPEGLSSKAPRSQLLWCLVTYRNATGYPVSRVDHFRSRRLAEAYRQGIEPTTPLISCGGRSLSPVPTVEEWERLKSRMGWKDYDYVAIHGGSGGDARDLIVQPADEVRIFKEG